MKTIDKIAMILVVVFIPLATLLLISGGIISVFNALVGQIVLFTGVGIALFCVMLPYIIWNIIAGVSLIREEEDYA